MLSRILQRVKRLAKKLVFLFRVLIKEVGSIHLYLGLGNDDNIVVVRCLFLWLSLA